MAKLLQHIIIGLLIFLLLINFSCRKEDPIPEDGNKIEIGTTTIDSISYYSSTISTMLISTGGNQITQHGHCWSIDKEPTIEDKSTKLGSIDKPGKFTSELDSLTSGEKYYVRSYMTHSLGTMYDVEKKFSTLNTGKPVVTTSEVQNVTLFAVECGGVVVNDSGLVVTARGVCWNTTEIPTLENCIAFTTDSIGIGTFTSQVTNLQEGSTYFICAYATNSKGSSYGEVKSFITIPLEFPEVTTGSVTSITTNSAQCNGNVLSDGNGTVTARGVCWSTSINPTINDPYTTNGSGTGNFVSQLTGLTPYTTYYVRTYATNEVGTAYGNQESFTTLTDVLPLVTTTEVTNITQISATSGGNVTSNGGGTVSARGVCWSTSENPTLDDPYTTNGSGTGSFVSPFTGLTPNIAYYVRAYAIDEAGTAYGNQISFTTLTDILPSVTTTEVTNITQTSATSGGNVISIGGGVVSSRGVCWSTSVNPTIDNSHTTNGTGTGTFVSQLTGLTPNTAYYVRAYATNEAGTAYGEERSFFTDLLCGELTINYGGQVYHTVEIGTQCWFKENLNIGMRINGTQDQINNSIVEKYCYNDQVSNCNEYGGLYQWDEMMHYVTTGGTQGICPEGWHIPTDGEWDELVNFLGGSSVAGGKLKEAGYDHWNSPNTGASNSSGFTGLPGGFRRYNGSFGDLGNIGYFLSSSQADASRAWYRNLFYGDDDVYRFDGYKAYGYSVRCLQD